MTDDTRVTVVGLTKEDVEDALSAFRKLTGKDGQVEPHVFGERSMSDKTREIVERARKAADIRFRPWYPEERNAIRVVLDRLEAAETRVRELEGERERLVGMIHEAGAWLTEEEFFDRPRRVFEEVRAALSIRDDGGTDD